MSVNPIGTIYGSDQRIVISHVGVRGARGVTGEVGGIGPQGESILIRGNWQSGATYSPLDGVTARSTGSLSMQSLFLQMSSYPTSVSTTEPWRATSRWIEVGLSELDGGLGGVWKVTQAGHPFTKIGQPAGLSMAGYVLADANTNIGIAMVSEVIDDSQFILQSTGGISNVDQTIFIQGGQAPGKIYYVSPSAGYLQVNKPTGISQYTNPIFLSGPSLEYTGVVLPWQAVETETALIGLEAQTSKFYYTANAAQTDFLGVDNDGNTPDFDQPLAGSECYQNGLNLSELTGYSLTTDRLTLATPAEDGDEIEIWLQIQAPVVAVGRVLMDTITFNGFTTDYPLEVSSIPTVPVAAEYYDVLLDGNPQQPYTDFSIIDVGGDAQIRFSFPPPVGTENWIVRST